ncbi:MAG: hypothetical protein BWX48_00076 [Verrucomicrobia bacterium ADurb.Bin006]|nr:MAG: hypothetical protein BWX48_00076 [Verrucomicrobia bacterium ADurb.Bin006]
MNSMKALIRLLTILYIPMASISFADGGWGWYCDYYDNHTIKECGSPPACPGKCGRLVFPPGATRCGNCMGAWFHYCAIVPKWYVTMDKYNTACKSYGGPISGGSVIYCDCDPDTWVKVGTRPSIGCNCQ